jgi:Zn finger protein HypA/HybF involved in hydrogenase expression
MKSNTKEFIQKAQLIHENKYDYSLTNYIGAEIKVKIKCNKCNNIFEQSPHNHLHGQNCPYCYGHRKITTEEFIQKAQVIHNNKYDYSQAEYKGDKIKLKIICPKHGVFEQTPMKHLDGQGCSKCSGNMKSNTKEFIQEAQLVHGNKYNYSFVNYTRAENKVKIKCNKCNNIFEQSSRIHLKGSGCSKCKGTHLKTNKEFIKEAQLVHGNKYDYSLVEYIGTLKKVKIKCNKCNNVFEQAPSKHINGNGCPKCNGTHLKTNDEFIKEAQLVHGNKYDYSLIDYKGAFKKIEIKCNKCGNTFKQDPVSHLDNHGCPHCNESKGEIAIRNFLIQHNINFEPQKSFPSCKYKNVLAFDFYLTNQNILIEFQGIQHYKPVPYWGGEEALKGNKIRDKVKKEWCKKNNIQLVEIKYNQFKSIDNILTKIIF